MTYLCWFHEPENDGTASAFVPGFRQFATVVHGVGKPNVKATLILMSWTWNAASGRNPSDWWPGADYVDAVGLDGYNPYNATNNLTWKKLADIFQAPLTGCGRMAPKRWALPSADAASARATLMPRPTGLPRWRPSGP